MIKARERSVVTSELSALSISQVHQDSAGEVHVFAHPNEEVTTHQDDKGSGEVSSNIRVVCPWYTRVHFCKFFFQIIKGTNESTDNKLTALDLFFL